MLERATGLLSELTSYAAVVVGPSHETATIRSVQLVGPVAPHVRCSSSCSPTAPSRSAPSSSTARSPTTTWPRPARSWPRTWSGAPSAGPGRRRPAGRGPVDRLVRGRRPAPSTPSGGDIESDQVFVGGPARLAESFEAVETVRSVLEHPRAAAGRGDAAARRPRPRAVGRHRHRARLRAAGLVRRRRRAGDGRRPGPRRGRPARPDPDGLPAGPGRRARGGRAAGRTAGSGGARWPVTDGLGDLYELLGVRPRRQRRGDQAGLPRPRPRAAPRHQPR